MISRLIHLASSFVCHLGGLLGLGLSRREDGVEGAGVAFLRFGIQDRSRLSKDRRSWHSMRLLLRLLILGEGADGLDLLPLAAALDGFRSCLQEVQRLAGLL